jgi:hypothetical protein
MSSNNNFIKNINKVMHHGYHHQ